jgi:SAM-dependent methyltransferase
MTASADRHRTAPRLAFGVDPSRPERYSLRQARYAALADDISAWAGAAARRGETLALLDVGCGWGPLLRHLDTKPYFDNIAISAADVTDAALYRKDLYREYVVGDLTGGYPAIPSSLDVVVCEQVPAPRHAAAIATLVRVLRPGGTLVIGVPIFLPPCTRANTWCRFCRVLCGRTTRRISRRSRSPRFCASSASNPR